MRYSSVGRGKSMGEVNKARKDQFSNLFYTPKELWKAVVISVIFWILLPVNSYLTAVYVEMTQGRTSEDASAAFFRYGVFSIEWLILTPFASIIYYQILHDYPGRVSLRVWNSQREIRSFIWTGIFGFLIVLFIRQSASDILYIPPRLLFDIFSIVILACARSVIVAKNRG